MVTFQVAVDLPLVSANCLMLSHRDHGATVRLRSEATARQVRLRAEVTARHVRLRTEASAFAKAEATADKPAWPVRQRSEATARQAGDEVCIFMV
jgi:hypothetical protein